MINNFCLQIMAIKKKEAFVFDFFFLTTTDDRVRMNVIDFSMFFSHRTALSTF